MEFSDPVLSFSPKTNPDTLQQDGVLIHCHVENIDLKLDVHVTAFGGWASIGA